MAHSICDHIEHQRVAAHAHVAAGDMDIFRHFTFMLLSAVPMDDSIGSREENGVGNRWWHLQDFDLREAFGVELLVQKLKYWARYRDVFGPCNWTAQRNYISNYLWSGAGNFPSVNTAQAPAEQGDLLPAFSEALLDHLLHAGFKFGIVVEVSAEPPIMDLISQVRKEASQWAGCEATGKKTRKYNYGMPITFGQIAQP